MMSFFVEFTVDDHSYTVGGNNAFCRPLDVIADTQCAFQESEIKAADQCWVLPLFLLFPSLSTLLMSRGRKKRGFLHAHHYIWTAYVFAACLFFPHRYIHQLIIIFQCYHSD